MTSYVLVPILDQEYILPEENLTLRLRVADNILSEMAGGDLILCQHGSQRIVEEIGSYNQYQTQEGGGR